MTRPMASWVNVLWGGLTHQDQVVIFGELFKQQAQFAQGLHLHQMGVVNDDDEGSAGTVQGVSFSNEPFLTGKGIALVFGFKSVAQHFHRIKVGVQGAADVDHQGCFFRLLVDAGPDHGFAGARFSHEQAKAALVGMNFQDVKDLLLQGQKRDICGTEWIGVYAVKRPDHIVLPSFELATRSSFWAWPILWDL